MDQPSFFDYIDGLALNDASIAKWVKDTEWNTAEIKSLNGKPQTPLIFACLNKLEKTACAIIEKGNHNPGFLYNGKITALTIVLLSSNKNFNIAHKIIIAGGYNAGHIMETNINGNTFRFTLLMSLFNIVFKNDNNNDKPRIFGLIKLLLKKNKEEDCNPLFVFRNPTTGEVNSIFDFLKPTNVMFENEEKIGLLKIVVEATDNAPFNGEGFKYIYEKPTQANTSSYDDNTAFDPIEGTDISLKELNEREYDENGMPIVIRSGSRNYIIFTKVCLRNTFSA